MLVMCCSKCNAGYLVDPGKKIAKKSTWIYCSYKSVTTAEGQEAEGQEGDHRKTRRGQREEDKKRGQQEEQKKTRGED